MTNRRGPGRPPVTRHRVLEAVYLGHQYTYEIADRLDVPATNIHYALKRAVELGELTRRQTAGRGTRWAWCYTITDAGRDQI